jgi:type I restriction enzyme S subunit
VVAKDVLFATTRPNLKNVAVFDGDIKSPVASTGFCILRAAESIDYRYLFHFLTTDFVQNQISPYISGTQYPAITDSNLKRTQIPVPPLDEQKRIVAKLDALFFRIDAAITHLQETLELSNSLFASALIGSFKENSDWMSVKIKEIFNVVNGRAYKRPELLESGKYPVVRIQNLKGGEAYFYSDLELKKEKYCDAGDLLYSWSGTPGTSFGAFIWKGGKAIYHYHIWKMEPLVDLDSRFGYWLLRNLTEKAIASSRGVAGMLHITKGMMESFVVQLPPIEEQTRVAGYLDALAEHIRSLEAETKERLDQLTAVKSSLLDAAFRGQL